MRVLNQSRYYRKDAAIKFLKLILKGFKPKNTHKAREMLLMSISTPTRAKYLYNGFQLLLANEKLPSSSLLDICWFFDRDSNNWIAGIRWLNRKFF